jgi:hypothetical protein
MTGRNVMNCTSAAGLRTPRRREGERSREGSCFRRSNLP